MTDPQSKPRHTWVAKFRDAFAGVWLGMRGQSSFTVHLVMAAMVLVCGAAFRVSRIEWCILLLCITIVLAAEMFNSAIEWLARAIDRPNDPHVAGALDIGSAAVLLASIGAATVGTILFVFRLGVMLDWWAASTGLAGPPVS